MAGTSLTYADRLAVAPRLQSLGGTVDGQARSRILVTGSVPLVISFGAHWVFFIAYWLPETAGVPGHHWWLNQLAPLVSRLVTSAGDPQVPAETGWWDGPALLLLLCSLAVYAFGHTRRFWFGPAGLAVPVVIGTVVAIGEVVGLAIGGDVGRSWLSVLLLAVWVGTAAYAMVHKIFDDPSGRAATSRRESLGPLVAYALILPAPVALGRMLFGHELRDAAVMLQGNTLTGRQAALTTPATLLFYACGLLIGVAVWIAWQWWPPRPHLPRYAITLVALLGVTAALGWPASAIAAGRVQTLAYDSPVRGVHFSCGTLPLDAGPPTPGAPRQPLHSLIVTGFSCRTVTTFVGYRQQTSETLSSSLSPLSARTPEGVAVTSRLVAAQYPTALIVAAGNRIDTAPDRLIWLDPVDGRAMGEYRCGTGRSRPMFVRFARVPGGDDPALGHITQREKRPTVVVNCEGQTHRIDPARPPFR